MEKCIKKYWSVPVMQVICMNKPFRLMMSFISLTCASYSVLINYNSRKNINMLELGFIGSRMHISSYI